MLNLQGMLLRSFLVLCTYCCVNVQFTVTFVYFTAFHFTLILVYVGIQHGCILLISTCLFVQLA